MYCICRLRTSVCQFLIHSFLHFMGCFLLGIECLAVSPKNYGIEGSRQRGRKGEKGGQRVKGRGYESG